MIRSSDIPGGVRGFGASISGGFDVNGDHHLDISVGAYLGDRAYILKSRPVVRFDVQHNVNTTLIPSERKFSNCHRPDGKKYHCVRLDVTLTYEGEGM